MKIYSVYSFWKDILGKKDLLKNSSTFLDFPFDRTMFSYVRKGRGFPDFAIKANRHRSVFTGGEFVKLKSRNHYSIAPFKSAIPSGKAKVTAIFTNAHFDGFHQSQIADEYLLEERDVYYLISGRSGNHQKVCLVHGSFFETVDKKELIQQSLIQTIEQNLSSGPDSEKVAEYIQAFAINSALTDRLPDIENASVNFKLKITAEVTPEGNILNSRMYPDILDDTINLVVPYHTDEERESAISKIDLVFGHHDVEQIRVFSIKHPFNGWFVVFQTDL